MSPSERRLLRVLAENQSVILNALSELSKNNESAALLHQMAQLTAAEIKMFDEDVETTKRFNEFVKGTA